MIGPKQKRFGGSRLSISSLTDVLFFIRQYVLFNRLQRRRIQNESPVLLSTTPGVSREAYERICQVFFERFNVAGFCILERPMTQP